MRTILLPHRPAKRWWRISQSRGSGEISVKTSASPPTAGTTSGEGSFPKGSSVTVTATPDDCYNFVEWTLGGVKVSTENPYTIASLTKTDALVAVFALDQYTISTASSPANAGTTSGGGKKGCGTKATLTAT